MSDFFHSKVFAGALTGLVSAAGVDLHAFLKWQSFHDAATYAWGIAAWRWCQGAVTGALVGGGFGAMVS